MPAIGTYRHRVTVQNPGASVPDGDGGYTEGWADAVPPTLDVSITPATTRDLERVTAGTSLATATHLIRGRWHAGISTSSRLLFKGRMFHVIFVGNPDERDTEITIVAAEVLTPPTPPPAAQSASAPAPAWATNPSTAWNSD